MFKMKFSAVMAFAFLLFFFITKPSRALPEENSTALRVNLGYATIKSDIKAESTSAPQPGKFGNGAVGQVGIDYFFNKYLAIELNSGLEFLKFTNSVGKNGENFTIPLMALGQIHLPLNEGKFSPYIGGGYAYRFVINNVANTDIGNTGGAVTQIGFDFFPVKGFGFNVDAKYMIGLNNHIEDNSNIYKNKFSVLYITTGIVIPF